MEFFKEPWSMEIFKMIRGFVSSGLEVVEIEARFLNLEYEFWKKL